MMTIFDFLTEPIRANSYGVLTVFFLGVLFALVGLDVIKRTRKVNKKK